MVIEKTARELHGTPCLELEDVTQLKQEICCSRMFGDRLRDITPIHEAVATYAARASEKLRAQQSLCKRVRVSIRTGMFNPDEPRFAKGIVCEPPYPHRRHPLHYPRRHRRAGTDLSRGLFLQQS